MECLCAAEYPTSVLIHQAIEEDPQSVGAIYSVVPYFGDGVISYLVQLTGPPNGFQLNSSTAVILGTSGLNSTLVVVPQHVKGQDDLAVHKESLVAQVTAVTFRGLLSMQYDIRLNNGSMALLDGLSRVEYMHLLDPAAPPELSLITADALEESSDRFM